ncbi:MAG: hypothetical protein M3Y65_13415 [Pseudomonadota bacterium]|nr:hypothetical protein [Pseudomonadota bacterium]
MEKIQDNVLGALSGAESTLAAPASPSRPRHSLPPKGSCWYCEKPLDNVRRFCGKECADGFDDEAAFSQKNAPA